MRKIAIYAVIIITSVCLFSACATIISGPKQKVKLNTNPQGARVYINGEDGDVTTPCQIKVRRKKTVIYTFRKDGYEDGIVEQKGTFNPVVIGNVIIGGIVGGLIDYATGAVYELPEIVLYDFETSVSVPVPLNYPAESPASQSGEVDNDVRATVRKEGH